MGEHNATKISPFYANYGFHPRFFDSLPPTDFNDTDERVTAYVFALDQQLILHQVRDIMAESQNEMSFYANRHRRGLTFNVGDQVLVHRDSTLLGNEPGWKFTKLWIGPVKVTRVINNNAYEVSFPMYLLTSRYTLLLQNPSRELISESDANFDLPYRLQTGFWGLGRSAWSGPCLSHFP